jgi:hypothetical protein
MSVYKRSNRIYYTPAQVTVFLNSYLIDDACAIAYDAIDNWLPMWGHNDRVYRTLAQGTTIVTGDLIVRFRYHGYLKRAITAVTDIMGNLAGSADQVPAMRKQQTVQTLSDAVLQQDSALLLNYLDAAGEAGEDSYKRASDFLKARFWGQEVRDPMQAELGNAAGAESQETRDNRRAYTEYMRPSVVREKHLRLRVVHGPDENVGKRAFAEVLERVQFRGKSYKANIEVPEGEKIQVEVYPFFAADLRPV